MAEVPILHADSERVARLVARLRKRRGLEPDAEQIALTLDIRNLLFALLQEVKEGAYIT